MTLMSTPLRLPVDNGMSVVGGPWDDGERERRGDPGRRLRQQSACARGLADPRLAKDEIDMFMMPPTSDNPERDHKVDGCPSCVVARVRPAATISTAISFVASYHCPACGHYWLTSWGDEAVA